MASTTYSPTLAASGASSRRAWRALLPGARWVSPLAIVVIWQLASSTGLLPEKTLESPVGILQTTWDLIRDGQLTAALATSLRRAVIGFLIGATVAVIAGTAAGLSRP